MAALIRARREYTYEIDAASLMLTSEHWIPIEGVHELPLIDALVAQHRRFVKPLRYDARSAAAFPNALLLDAGPAPVPLHVVSAFMDPKERLSKERAIAEIGAQGAWVWRTEEPMPPGCAGTFEPMTVKIPASATSSLTGLPAWKPPTLRWPQKNPWPRTGSGINRSSWNLFRIRG
jgi:hypothetical protein